MKKYLLIGIALVMAIVDVQAQKKQPANIRMEIIDLETDNSEYSIFTYKDNDDTFGYYLSLGKVTKGLGAIRSDIIDMSFDSIKETCISLGSTYDEALATIDTILALFDQDFETTKEFQGRASTGSERLGEPNTTTCIVKKKPLGGKRLLFLFTCGNKQAEAYLSKSALKDLRTNLKLDKKLHPKHYQ